MNIPPAAAADGLLSLYHAELREKLQKPHRFGPTFLYRGQENADWPLRSSAMRRFHESMAVEEAVDPEVFVRYHREELLQPATLAGWRKDSYTPQLHDLELLAKLRHYGAAVCLLDFTTRFDIALWFACQEVKPAKGGAKDGRIFIVDIDSAMNNRAWPLGKITPEILRYDMDSILKPVMLMERLRETTGSMPKFWYWQPETLMGRMLSQESRFLFGPRDIPEGEFLDCIDIKAEHKKDLLEELEQQQGLRPESVFADIHGFAEANSHSKALHKRRIAIYRDMVRNEETRHTDKTEVNAVLATDARETDPEESI